MPLRARRIRVDVQIAKMPAKRFLLFQIDLLIAEEQNLMLREGRVQIINLLVRQRGGQVDIGNLGAQTWGHRFYLDRGIGHDVIPYGTRACANSMLSRTGASAGASETKSAVRGAKRATSVRES
jgi:hypothetical protein